MLLCSNAPMLQCSNAPMLQCTLQDVQATCNLKIVLLLQCSNAPMLPWSMKRCTSAKGVLTSCLSAQAALVWTGSGRVWPWLSRVSNERKARTKLISGSEEARNSRDIDVASPIRPRPSVAIIQHTLISSSEKTDKIFNVSWENK